VNLKARTTFLDLECEDGETYEVKTGIKGWLIEVNQRFLENPNILLENVILMF
jgi:hypothetical protein